MGFKALIDKYKGKRDFLIYGAANSVRLYDKEIKEWMKKANPITIGINRMTHVHVPDYHLWVNNKRLKRFHKCIQPKSTLLLGSHLFRETLGCVSDKDNDRAIVPYTDDFHNKNEPIEYKDGVIKGFFRIGGNLAIMIAHLMGARNIYVIGADGYSKPQEGTQHCYGEGFTDSDDMEWEKKKDHFIYRVLRNIDEAGIKFKIITPTIYSKFYDGSILCL